MSGTIQALVKTTLELSGKPVERINYPGEAETYVTFQRIFRSGSEYADDEKTARKYTFGADVYSKKNTDALVDTIEAALEAAGFNGVTVESEIYESETGYYHVPLTFYYTEVL